MSLRLPTILVAPIMLTAACVDPYYPGVETSPDKGFLVVDGYIDGAAKTGTIKLSRSIALGAVTPSQFETNAYVTIEDNENHSVPLAETSDGIYAAADLDLNSASTYTLHIQTQDGSSYSSDPIELKKSPSFDSLVWRPKEDGVHFYVNAHDEHNTTRYYQYRFTETWEYRVPVVTRYKWGDNGFPVKRKDNEYVTFCWSSVDATSVIVKSTTNLKQDVVDMFPIHWLKKGTRRLTITYSLLVQQRAISADEYGFLSLLDETSESLGGLFDPIPAPVVGNVHNNNDSSEPVLGYFSGGFPSEKRIFISYDDLPKELQVYDEFEFQCNVQVVNLDNIGTNNIVEVDNPVLNRYYVASPNCSDCRTLGGDTLKPKYWPQ